MRRIIREFVRVCAETLPVAEPIYEFGAYQVPPQLGFADLRPFFPGKQYVGADFRPGPGVDVVLDLQQIDLPDETAGTVLALETLEHVEYPRRAISEAYRILRPGGTLVISSVMNFPIHDHPHDYWRFTPEAFRALLKPFATSWVWSVGDRELPHTVVGVGMKKEVAEGELADFQQRMQAWQAYWDHPLRGGWKYFSRSLFPPLWRSAYRRLRGK